MSRAGDLVRAIFNPPPAVSERMIYPLSFDEWASYFNLGNYGYQNTLTSPQGTIEQTYDSMIQGAYKANGVVFACMLARQYIFQQARFVWRNRRNGRAGNIFGNAELGRLEVPWTNGTTADLNGRAIQDADLAGTAYVVRRGQGLRRLIPNNVDIIIAGPAGLDGATGLDFSGVDAEIAGYRYWPNGRHAGPDPVFFLPDVVAHWAPIPDPQFRFRGMSWLTPIVREILADGAATQHKLKFFENGATPNMIVKLNTDNLEKFERWVAKIDENNAGVRNAGKTMYVGMGADTTVVGANLQQASFKETQGAGETRIAAAAGIHPVIVGLSEGLAGSSLNAGNFNSARRLTADKTFRPLWQGWAGALQSILNVPGGAELWYNEDEIEFLQEDRKDAADIEFVRAQTLRHLVDTGFTADSAVAAVDQQDVTLLVHTGLFSVQLQAPGSTKMPTGEVPGESPVADGTAPVETGTPPAPAAPSANGTKPSAAVGA